MGPTWNSLFPPKAKFSVDDIPDLTGKITIVTGGNTGIGKETAKALLNHNAKVYIASRNTQKAEEAIKDLKHETGKDAHFIKLDLADLKSIKAAAEDYTSKEKELHVLFNSGGVMAPPIGDMTADGYDLQFGTNVLGHFYFTKLLLPTLLSTAKSSSDGTVRVINTSSMGHSFASEIDFDTLRDGEKRKKLGTQRLYCQSKFGNVVFSDELARRYGKEGIVSVSLHPGNLKSELDRHASRFQKSLTGWMLYPVPMGALTQLYAATAANGSELNGKYLVPWARVGTARKETQNLENATKLWTWLEDQVKDL